MNESQLPVDIAATPFSVRGSWMAVSVPDDQDQPGIYLRTVRGAARHREIMRIELPGAEMPTVDVTAGRVRLTTPGARVMIALEGPGRAIFQVERGWVDLVACIQGPYDVVLEESASSWRYIDSGAVRNYHLRLIAGETELDTGWDREHSTHGRLRLSRGRGDNDGPAVLVLDEFESVPPKDVPDVDRVVADAELDYKRWWERHGAPTPVATTHPRAARLATYVTWSSLVPAGGVLERESMLMSKNRMSHVWSWDHCFNALALWRDPVAAAGQLLTLFDHQDEHGALPDHIDDHTVQRNFVKPPVHGWAVKWLLARDGLEPADAAALVEPLARWTDWWGRHRTYGHETLPSYNHGNDSGWDNSTVFAAGVPVQSPDLLAFLALQEDAVASLHQRAGDEAEAQVWRSRSRETVGTLVHEFWRGDRFVARHVPTGDDVHSNSLLMFMPLALGELLPVDVFRRAVASLEDGGWLTTRGPATEPPGSSAYEADGYWRGPIWAPSTMLLVDGLRRGGHDSLARDVSVAFLRTCAASGMAENFDAVSGAGLRDQSMTWTASVFLAL